MGKVFGIDLGTTYSVISTINEYGKPEVFLNEDGDRATPSVILFEEADSILVGKYALENAAFYQENVARFIKREMGKSPEEFHQTFFGKTYSAPALSAIILKHLKNYASLRAGEQVKDVVITVPAYFDNKQRNATLEAGRMAGLNVMEVINEPTAAAFAFGIDRSARDQTLFVFDLGGGTFDVSVVKVHKKEITVLASDGDHQLGGVDWDSRIVDAVREEFTLLHQQDPADDPATYQDLLNRANSAKHNLSRRPKDNIQVNYEGFTVNVQITRERFEKITADLLKRCQDLCLKVLDSVGMEWKHIDQVLMVGGSTRMPMVREMVKRISGMEPNTSVNPDEVVSTGAAYKALLLSLSKGDEHSEVVKNSVGQYQTFDVNSHSIGISVYKEEDKDELAVNHILKKNQRIPCEGSRTFITRYENQIDVALPILQGESDEPSKCTLLEEVQLGPLPFNLPKGTPVSVTLRFNENNVLEVYAECQGVKKKVDIKNAKTHTENELEEMAKHLEQVAID